MRRSEYKAIANHPLRGLLGGAASSWPQSRAETISRVAAMESIPEERRDEVVDAIVDVARKARSGSAWEARQFADQRTVDFLRDWAKADQLVEDPDYDPFPADASRSTP